TLPLTPEHNLAYLRELAEVARGLNLSIGQKNAPDLIAELAGSMDFLIVDSCFRWNWCAAVTPYIEAGKPVFGMEFIEAEIAWEDACAEAAELGIQMILKSKALDMARLTCGETS
ncbi:MAG: endo alpha-1,4 polygalactosaminidase, partial [Pseudomonadota bacterium]